jgi:hypothetical protein
VIPIVHSADHLDATHAADIPIKVSAMHHGIDVDCRAVEKHVVDSERKTNHGDRGDIARGLDNLVQGIAAGIE